jgi:hypothetical protein
MKRDRAAAAAFFHDQPEWDLTIAHWIETGEKRYGAGTVRSNVLALAEAFAAHSVPVDNSSSSHATHKREREELKASTDKIFADLDKVVKP